jgi:cellulose biosynthesis protein BcsQ
MAMRYAVWNNKGGVGKSFLSFILGTEIAHRKPDEHVILVDMCPQANLSEIVLGGNGSGAAKLQTLLAGKHRKTVGGYFDARISSPHLTTGTEADYLLNAHANNKNLPKNLWLIAGDPSLELQAQVIAHNCSNWGTDSSSGLMEERSQLVKGHRYSECRPLRG